LPAANAHGESISASPTTVWLSKPQRGGAVAERDHRGRWRQPIDGSPITHAAWVHRVDAGRPRPTSTRRRRRGRP